MNSLNKPPLERPNILKAEVAFPKELESKFVEELKQIFDYCSKISNDPQPISTTPDGTGLRKGQSRTLSSGKVIEAPYYSLQDTKFPEIFDLISPTVFLDSMFKDFFQQLVSDKSVFIIFFKMLLELDVNNNEQVETVFKFSRENNIDPSEFISALQSMQKKYSALISPSFQTTNDKQHIHSSDLLNNLFFVKTGGPLYALQDKLES